MTAKSNKLGDAVYFDTLGCAKNLCDTHKMEQSISEFGFQITDNPNKAKAIILNTCAFIEAATQESIDTFFDYKNTYSNIPIVVVGCMPSRYGDDLSKSLSEASLFLKCSEEDKLAKALISLNLKPGNMNSYANNGVCAYVKISDGCNRNCSYCMIPKIRGKYKSASYEEIYKDTDEAISNGAKEIVLVAQDCGVWGRDINSNLVQLLDDLSSSFSNTLFRILYIQPDALNSELLSLINSRNNISKYLDIPLQHCNPKLLKAMNRKGDANYFLEMIKSIRKEIPQCTLRSTFIVGFPGESEDQFDELCDFVEKANFDYAGCFEYSNEEGSASSKLKNQVPENIKYSRTNKLREILDTISLANLEKRVGNTYQVLIEGEEEGRIFGRAPFQAPEVDGVVFISEFCNTENIAPGDIVNVKIQDTEGYDLVGVVIND